MDLADPEAIRRCLDCVKSAGLDLYSEIQNFCLTPHPNHFYTYAILSHSEGRLAIVTDAGRDAVDADALLTNGV